MHVFDWTPSPSVNPAASAVGGASTATSGRRVCQRCEYLRRHTDQVPQGYDSGYAPQDDGIPGIGGRQVGAFGDGSLVLASTARWLAASPRHLGMALGKILTHRGVLSLTSVSGKLGKPVRRPDRYSVLPWGSQDGELVWLVYLDSPDVLLYTTADKSTKRIARALPFAWKRLPNDFMPSMLAPLPGRPTIPPFDVITYGADADADGRAFILTALESSQLANGEPTAMAVDVIHSRFQRPCCDSGCTATTRTWQSLLMAIACTSSMRRPA